MSKVIEEQKRAYFQEKSIEKVGSTSEIDENDDHFYDTPQIFLHQLFKLYKKGLVDDKNIRDQVYLMVNVFLNWNLCINSYFN